MDNDISRKEVEEAFRVIKMNPRVLLAFNLILNASIRSHYATLKLATDEHELFRSQGAVQALEKIVNHAEKS